MAVRKILPVILAVLMLAGVAGCAGDTQGSSAAPDESSAGSASSHQTQTPSTPTIKGTTYYISSSGGSDSNDGKSENTAWKSVKNLSKIALQPGDGVLFKAGDTFEISYAVNGKGSDTAPIVISSYGSGRRPVLTAGDAGYAIMIKNTGDVVISGLDFVRGDCGVSVLSDGSAETGGVRIVSCNFSDHAVKDGVSISGADVKLPRANLVGGTGVSIASSGSAAISNVSIEGCAFYYCDAGVTTMRLSGANTYKKPTAFSPAVSGLAVKDCDFYRIRGCAALLLTNAENASISGCDFSETGWDGNSKADTSALRIAASKKVTVSDTAIDLTYAYSSSSTGSAVLFEGINSDIKFKGCEIKDNVGTAFSVVNSGVFSQGKSEKIVFEGCALENNNVSLSHSNSAFASDSADSVTISGGQIGLHNNAQKYKGIVNIRSDVNIYNASGSALQGKLPKDAVISSVKVGVGKAKITPEERTFLWGYTEPGSSLEKYSWCDPATDILDDTFVKVLVFEDAKTKERLLFLIADMCIFREPENIPEGTVKRWAQKAGVSEDKVYLSTTHDHQGSGALTEKYIARIDAQIEKAVKSMQTVKMGITTVEETVSVSRRPNLGISYGMPFDSRMMVINFTSVETGKPVTYAVNIPIHNTALGNSTPSNLKYNTSELTGLAMAYIEAKAGNGLTSVFINGAYGDAGPDVYGDYNTDYQSIKKRANELGAAAYKILQNTPTKAMSGVKGAVSTTKVSYRPAEKIILSAAKIGDLGFFGVNGEIFTGIGAAIQAKSPSAHTITTANTNGFISYMPTYAAIHDGRGGYGVTSANVFRDDIEKVVTDGAVSLLSSLVKEKESAVTVKSVSGGKANQSMVPKAFDNDATTAWEGKDKNDMWFQCDLGESKVISKVAVDFGNYSRYDAAADYDIFVSDSKNFSSCVLYASVRGNSVCQLYHRADGIKGRYVRFVCLKSAKNNTSTPKVYEFTVYSK